MNMNSLFNRALTIPFLALLAVVVVYYLILSTINQGISCDEGFYLMGYLSNQRLGDFISDYPHIVRAITPIGWEENIMTYRIERLLVSLLVFPLFAMSLYRWLKQEFDFEMNRVVYYSLVFLACAQTYIFASPTISYDSIQVFVYLLAFSFYFLLATSSSKILKFLYSLAIGIVALIGVLNYFPSGLFLIGSLGLFTLVDFPKTRIKILFNYILGLILGILIYHFLVRNLIEYATIAFDVIVKTFTEKSESGHDAEGLLSSFFSRFGYFLIYIPIIFSLSFVFKKVKFSQLIAYSLLIVSVLILLLIRQIYSIYAPIYFIPVALMMVFLLTEKNIFSLNRNIRFWVWTIILVVLPFFAVFGTNQNLYTKMTIFIPFWLLLFFMIYSKVENINYKHPATLLSIVVLLGGYVYLGNFSRYHYYYTPRSSKYQLKNEVRKQNIKLSKYQQQYFTDVLDTLQHYGAKKEDKYLAFGENQMAVFLLGGYVDGKLPYHWFQYTEVAQNPPKFLILFKNEEQEVIELLEDSHWNFPQKYKRIEMRPMSENMNQEELKTIIYVPKR